MQRQRDGLVPIGEALADLGGPHPGASAKPHQRRGGDFTVADQVNQLVGASEADPNLGFMGRTMALCSLPRSNPGNQLQYKRTNGPFTLGMIAGLGNKLPYGNLPRLLLAWVSTEAVRTQSREGKHGEATARRVGTADTHDRRAGDGGPRRQSCGSEPKPRASPWEPTCAAGRWVSGCGARLSGGWERRRCGS